MVPRFCSLFAFLFVVVFFCPVHVHAQDNLLGKISFPNSGDNKAQDAFIEGVLYLHNFEYEDAARAFRNAQELDPDFALAYWGEAKTYNHPIWMQQDRDAAMDVLQRLGATLEERLKKAPTEREKAYLLTLETLYGNTTLSRGKSKEERDDLYMEQMRRLHETYPEDHEAATFFGLSILGTAHEGRDFATYMRAAAVLQTVWEVNKKHPGAAHYLIHSYDDPIHAPLGLPMAHVYAEIAPAASHAQHMTSHIFVAMGMWDEVVRANEVARKVQNKRFVELGKREVVCGHYTYWLEYGYLQQGRFEEAEKVLGSCFDRINNNPTNSERWHFSKMFSRYILDTQDWDAVSKWAAPSEVSMEDYEAYLFTKSYAAVQRGDKDGALKYQRLLLEMGKNNEEISIMDLELQAVLALRDGNEDKALVALHKAVGIEAELPYEFGPPHIAKPSQELLGDVYMTLMKYEQAASAYQEQLRQTPLRTASLLGLAKASKEAGNNETAKDAYERLSRIWHLADAGIPGYKDAIMSQ